MIVAFYVELDFNKPPAPQIVEAETALRNAGFAFYVQEDTGFVQLEDVQIQLEGK